MTDIVIVDASKTPIEVSFTVAQGLQGASGFVPPLVSNFTINDWILNAGQYELDISHSFNIKYPRVEIKDDADNDIEIPYIPITNNLIRLYLPLEPECRFNGKAIIGI